MSRCVSLLCPIVAMGLLCAPAPGAADATRDQLGPREIALGDSMRGDSRGALSITLNPSGLPGNAELVFEGSYGYRDADGASAITMSGCDSTGRLPGCFYYRYFGASPELGGVSLSRRGHDGGVALALPIGPRLYVGTNLKYFDYNSAVPGEGDTSGFTMDLGATLVLMPRLRVGVVGNHLFWAQSPQYPRALGVGVAVAVLDFLNVSADALWHLSRPDGESTGRYGGGVEFFLRSANGQSGYPLRVGAVHDVQLDGTYLSGGAGFMTGKVAVDVAVRQQIAGGGETLVLGSLRYYGPRRIPGTQMYR